MKYEFELEKYWEIRELFEDKEYYFKQIKIAESKGSELYVFGYRMYIPELNLTVRDGIAYFSTETDGEDYPEDAVVLYCGDENDPLKYSDCYCNTNPISLILMIAKDKNLKDNPKCYIDDNEFELLE